MNKKFIILFVFWWSLIFPSLSFNSLTTDITDTNINYEDFINKDSRKEILKNADYTLWILNIDK